MTRLFPKPRDKYPVVYLKDTDLDLPKHAVNNRPRYAFFKRIAKGGKCIIQSCKDLHLSRVVCYKSLRPELADDPYERRRFLREARVTAMLQHPNTIPVYELSRDTSGHYYFTMKLVAGITLREVLDQQRAQREDDGGYPLTRLVDILIQVCNALDYAHNHGVVHRDIKPANILLGPFGEVLVLDWGLAKVWGESEIQQPQRRSLLENKDPSLTSQGGLQGTALYMSPEQIAEAEDMDHRTDVYSVGAVLYEILTLENLAEGKTMRQLLDNITNENPLPPSGRTPNRHVPPGLERICLNCIPKDPDERYQTMAELRDELEGWLTRNDGTTQP